MIGIFCWSPCTLHDVLRPAAGPADPLSALIDVVRKIILSATLQTILIPKLGTLILEGIEPSTSPGGRGLGGSIPSSIADP